MSLSSFLIVFVTTVFPTPYTLLTEISLSWGSSFGLHRACQQSRNVICFSLSLAFPLALCPRISFAMRSYKETRGRGRLSRWLENLKHQGRATATVSFGNQRIGGPVSAQGFSLRFGPVHCPLISDHFAVESSGSCSELLYSWTYGEEFGGWCESSASLGSNH